MATGAASIHTGLWTNHQYNSIRGATLTLTATNASYLIAFLALFLGLVAGHLWAILSFAVFHIRSTPSKRDGQHHQQQAILRNYHTPGAAIWQLLKASWAWRQRRGIKAVISVLPVAVLAVIVMMSFAAAGVLSARIASTDSEVLIKRSGCGFWGSRTRTESSDDFVVQAAYRANLAEDINSASIMASMCQKNSSSTSGCVSYAPQKVEWTTTTDIPCPFQEKICYQNTTVRLDSGFVDSVAHLGINAPKRDRIFYRSVAECSPLVHEGYVQDWHDMNGTRFRAGKTNEKIVQTYPGELFLEWFYGASIVDGINSTLAYSNRDPTFTAVGTQSFSLSPQVSTLEDPSASGFLPISELNRTNADLNLLFLFQETSVEYSKPVNDPWFEAKDPASVTYEYQAGNIRNATVYNPKLPISTVGCTIQHQWCSKPSPRANVTCTDLHGIEPSIRQARQLFKSEHEKVILERIIQVIKEVGAFSKIIMSVPGSFLLMNKYGYYRVSAPADDQWIQELDHMFGVMLTSMQIRNYRFAGGYQSALDIAPNIQAPSANETWMCDAQLIRREDYQSLSVLGLALICSIGGLIILVNLILDWVVGWYQVRYNKRVYAMQEWEMLQAETLQRRLYMSQGVDLNDGRVCITDILDGVKALRRNDTSATLVVSESKTHSLMSVETMGTKHCMEPDVEKGTC